MDFKWIKFILNNLWQRKVETFQSINNIYPGEKYYDLACAVSVLSNIRHKYRLNVCTKGEKRYCLTSANI